MLSATQFDAHFTVIYHKRKQLASAGEALNAKMKTTFGSVEMASGGGWPLLLLLLLHAVGNALEVHSHFNALICIIFTPFA